MGSEVAVVVVAKGATLDTSGTHPEIVTLEDQGKENGTTTETEMTATMSERMHAAHQLEVACEM